jgi:hypothetical protein
MVLCCLRLSTEPRQWATSYRESQVKNSEKRPSGLNTIRVYSKIVLRTNEEVVTMEAEHAIVAPPSHEKRG